MSTNKLNSKKSKDTNNGVVSVELSKIRQAVLIRAKHLQKKSCRNWLTASCKLVYYSPFS